MIYRLIWTVAFVLAVSISILAVLYTRADIAGRKVLELEAGKAMFYVITGVLVASVVQVIVRDFEERRKAWLAHRDLLRIDLTDGLTKIYSEVKAIQARLRANVRDERIEVKTCSEVLQDLNDNRLRLEGYKRKAQFAVPILPPSMPQHLSSMERYLGELVRDYETAMRSERETIVLADLPILGDFIKRGRGSEFRSYFVDAYNDAAGAVAEAILRDLHP